HEVWTADQALTYIQRHPDEEQQADLLGALAPLIPTIEIHDLLPHIREIASEECLAHVLVTLAERLLDVERMELLHEALTIAEQLPHGVGRAKILLTIAPYFPHIDVNDAIGRALNSLVSFDEVDHQERDAMHWVFRINDDLAWAIKNLTEPLVPIGLKAVGFFRNHCDLAAVLALIAPRLSEEQLEEGLAIARS